MPTDRDTAVDPTLDTPSDPSRAPAAAMPASSAYRRLRLAGFTEREAGSLAGRLVGLPMVRGGWGILEVERLLFVRALVRAGRVGS